MTDGHLTDQLINAYVAGSASEGLSLVVAAHLTYCAECRAKVAAREAIAGAMLSEVAPESAPDFDALLDRLDESEPPRKEIKAGLLPRPVADMVGVNFDEIPWRFRLPGVYEHEFANADGEEMSLLKVMPGVTIPSHTHEAEELTVVFDGELFDGEKSYGVGDLAIADPSVDHHPRAGHDKPCICLAVLSGGLRFTGPFGRALNLFT